MPALVAVGTRRRHVWTGRSRPGGGWAGSLRTVGLALLAVVAAFGFVGGAQGASLGQFGEFATPTGSSGPEGIAAGSDGNLWFVEFDADKVGEINPTTHAITEFSLPTANAGPSGIGLGPDGNIWFTEFGANKIGEINPTTHVINEFATPTLNSGPVAIAAGSDGNMWFTESKVNKIGEISPSTKAITEYSAPAASGPFGITTGPDGNIWFTEKTTGMIGELSPSNPTVITQYAPPTPSSAPNEIATGPDGSLWFTESASGVSKIGELAASDPSVISEIPLTNTSSDPFVLVTGPDGNIWFTEGGTGAIGEIDPVTRTVINTFDTPTGSSAPIGIAVGQDGNLWFTEGAASKIGFVGAGVPAASINAPTISGIATPGSTLTCVGGEWSTWAGSQPSLSAFGFDGYEWLLNGSPVNGATSQTFTPVAADAGQPLSCRLTATYALQSTVALSTSATVEVGLPPSSSAPPTITGTAVAGSTLTEAHGTWANSPQSFSYQWSLCSAGGSDCSAIAGATGQAFTIPITDAGQGVEVSETASNQYGTGTATTSATTSIASLPQPAVVTTSFKGTKTALSIDCAGAAGQTCTGTYGITTVERVEHGSVVAVAAGTKTTSKTVTIASGSYTLPSDQTTALQVSLDKTGANLLSRFYKLPASLSLIEATGQAPPTPHVTANIEFSYSQVRSPVSFTWLFSPGFSTAEQLTVTGVPTGGAVEVLCHGGGCPFAKRHFAPKRRAVGLTSAFAHSRLSPGTEVDVEITAPDEVGKVTEFTIRRGKAPQVAKLCLPPGDSKPARCA